MTTLEASVAILSVVLCASCESQRSTSIDNEATASNANSDSNEGTKMDDRLSPLRTDIRYNFPKRQRRDFWKREGKYEYLATEKKIPELTSGEAEDVAQELELMLNGYFRGQKYPKVDEFGGSLYGKKMAKYSGWFHEVPFDRTVETLVTHPDFFSVNLIEHLQDELISERPLWRIRVAAWSAIGVPNESIEPSMMVYADSAWIGKRRYSSADLKCAMESWLKAMQECREENLGPKRRQLNFARSKVAEAFPHLDENPVVLLAVIARNDNSRSWWILHNPGYFDYSTVSEVARDGMRFAVNRSGEFRRGGGLREGDRCLREYIVPSDETDTLMVERRTDQRKFSLDLNADKVLSDRKLIELGFE